MTTGILNQAVFDGRVTSFDLVGISQSWQVIGDSGIDWVNLYDFCRFDGCFKPVEIKCHNEFRTCFCWVTFKIRSCGYNWDEMLMRWLMPLKVRKELQLSLEIRTVWGFPVDQGECKIRDSRGLHHVRNEEKLGLGPHFS